MKKEKIIIIYKVYCGEEKRELRNYRIDVTMNVKKLIVFPIKNDFPFTYNIYLGKKFENAVFKNVLISIVDTIHIIEEMDECYRLKKFLKKYKIKVR